MPVPQARPASASSGVRATPPRSRPEKVNQEANQEAPTPSQAPRPAPQSPRNRASIKNNRRIMPSRAPRHFMMPISRKRSVTDISWALTMPTAQTKSESTISHTSEGPAVRAAVA